MQGWYAQIPASPHLRLRITVRGRISYYWVVLPQGWKWSPILAQRISEVLLTDLPVKGIIYDNYLLGGTFDEMELALAEIVFRCQTIGASINYEKSTLEPQKTVSYCGAELNLRSKAYRNTPKWCAKVVEPLELVLSDISLSYNTIFKISGLIGWITNVRRLPFCLFRPILSAMRLIRRRVARGATWDDFLCVSDSWKDSVRTALNIMKINAYVLWSPPPTLVFHILSDASDWGFAWAIITDSSVMACYQQAWEPSDKLRPICEREFIAVSDAQKKILALKCTCIPRQ